MTQRFDRLSPAFGVEAHGFDVARLPESQFREIEQAFFSSQVLVLRGQDLTAGQFLEFARRFGPPEPHVIDQFHHPEHADILILSNVLRDGRATGLADAGTSGHFAQAQAVYPTLSQDLDTGVHQSPAEVAVVVAVGGT